jgi:hypothetical protein
MMCVCVCMCVCCVLLFLYVYFFVCCVCEAAFECVCVFVYVLMCVLAFVENVTMIFGVFQEPTSTVLRKEPFEINLTTLKTNCLRWLRPIGRCRPKLQ